MVESWAKYDLLDQRNVTANRQGSLTMQQRSALSVHRRLGGFTMAPAVIFGAIWLCGIVFTIPTILSSLSFAQSPLTVLPLLAITIFFTVVVVAIPVRRVLNARATRDDLAYKYGGVKTMRMASSGQSILQTPQCQHSSG